ncbi:hypothetical protein ABZX85_46990 [Streptomyces sp. NPDC004539]|uniref:nuclear transport factor 2 family protein n=1 Tax=Streptomyces sp. NPDC004539 TaxID=3154280 RepID=UPI00339E7AAC
MTHPTPALERLAAAFADAFTEGDVDALTSLLDPGAVIWHNHDRSSQSVAEWLGLATHVRAVMRIRYDDIRRHYFQDGWVQQSVVRSTSLDGAELGAVEAVFVALVRDARIVRLDEYLDSAQIPIPLPADGPSEGGS